MSSAAGVEIHPSSEIGEGARLGENVRIGPRCTIDARARIGDNVTLVGDVHIAGDTEIGPGVTIYPYACIGFGPQHIKYGPDTPVGGVRIGAKTVIREHATVHAAMHADQHTVLGESCYIMVAAHVGHDSVLGEQVIVCNSALLAGHCEVAERVYISGNVAVHQFCRIGKGAMLAGGTACNADVPPYAILIAPNQLGGLNLVGMRRAGIPREEITVARQAYRDAFRDRCDRAEQLRRLDRLGAKSAPVRDMAEFVRTTKRGVLSGDGRPRPHMLHWLRDALKKDAWAERGLRDLDDAPEGGDGLA